MQLAPIYPIVHQVLKPLFPECLWAGDEKSPMIALTFDDGPHPQHTPKLLKVLDRYGVVASFFWLGACVNRSPAIAEAIYRRGHWIGLHGYDHRSFPTLASDELIQSLKRTQTEISRACQIAEEAVLDVRPPNGFFTPKTLTLLKAGNYRSVMWSVVPEDWVDPGVSTVTNRVLAQVRNGSIIVLHDGHCGGEKVAEIVDFLIPTLLQQGYRFVTIDQIWQQTANQTSKLLDW
jgi:peptidoglycan/xylan/chitin deacetylase (PgdA/CDA1 family)